MRPVGSSCKLAPRGMQIQGFSVELDESSLPWRATRHPGVAWVALQDDTRHAQEGTTVLIRMDPGCGYPAHRHLGVEDVLILRGGYRDDRGEHRAGTWLRYEAGSTHAPVALGDRAQAVGPQNPSCLLFAIARGGVENL